MQSTSNGSKFEIDTTNKEYGISSVFFAQDEKEVLSLSGASGEGRLQRWQIADGKQVGQGIGGSGNGGVSAAALSPDCKWLVCTLGPSRYLNSGKGSLCVWDNRTNKKVLDIGGYFGSVSSIEISPDSTKLATAGSPNNLAFIWDINTGAGLVGPLQDGWVVAVRFSPSGDRIAAATRKENRDQWHGNLPDRYSNSIRIYNSDNGQELADIPFYVQSWTPLAWSPSGRQLFATSGYQVKCLDTSSGSLLGEWSIEGGYYAPTSVILSRNKKFIVFSSNNSLSFWGTSSHKKIGAITNHASQILCTALSSNDECIATGERNGRITLCSLHDVLPRIYFTLNVGTSILRFVGLIVMSITLPPHVLPLIFVTDTVFRSWTDGDLSRVEELLDGELVHSSDPFYHASTFAYRSLLRARLGQSQAAINDAKESLKSQRSAIGHIANAMALVCHGEQDSALRVFDLVFGDGLATFQDGLATEHNLLLLIKAIMLFKIEKYDDAILRVGDLIRVVDDQSLYITVRAQMLLVLGGMSLRKGDSEGATELLKRAREAIPFQKSPSLTAISLIFGWDFDKLSLEIQLHLQECIKPIEVNGDAAMQSEIPQEAILQYSVALTLDPLNPSGLLIKRSRAHGMLGLWEDALKDADEAIKADPPNPWGYQRRHAALHALQRFDEAVHAFTRMSSLIEESLDQEICQFGKNYVTPTRLESAIESVAGGILKICPPVLIDVESGQLSDEPERLKTFKSDPRFKELVSSMTEELDEERILRVVSRYFQYVMFSDVWEEKETSFQDINLVASVWNLESSSPCEKLKKFCKIVREDDYRWAWSDACVDKTVNTVLNQSLTMVYKWYEASAATLVFLAGVASPSTQGDLSNSVWMTQARTLQVALGSKVIRFYDRDWKPYLDDTSNNHGESTEIMQELADAIGVAQETIVAFDPEDLSVREKLRLASTRNATVEEDVAYSLIGIFKSDIQPHYGEGGAALGHLLEEIVARSGDVTVLSWVGEPSVYNSCLPATIAVYSQLPYTFPAVEDAEMVERVAASKGVVSQTDAMLIYDRVTRLPPARFANRRLHLPCIIFTVKKLHLQDPGSDQENRYRARVPGIGHVEFQTSDSLFTEPFKLVFAHPWIRDLRDPFDAFTWESDADEDEDEDGSDSGTDSEFHSVPSSPSRVPVAPMDDFIRALRLVVRLQQPFHALLLQQQRNGQFKRVAAEHEIELPGIDGSISFARDVRIEVVEIL